MSAQTLYPLDSGEWLAKYYSECEGFDPFAPFDWEPCGLAEDYLENSVDLDALALGDDELCSSKRVCLGNSPTFEPFIGGVDEPFGSVERFLPEGVPTGQISGLPLGTVVTCSDTEVDLIDVDSDGEQVLPCVLTKPRSKSAMKFFGRLTDGKLQCMVCLAVVTYRSTATRHFFRYHG